jgi:hypothetical protein
MELHKSISGKYTVTGLEGYFKTVAVGQFNHIFYCIPEAGVGLKRRDLIGSTSRGVYAFEGILANSNPQSSADIENKIMDYAVKISTKDPAAVALGAKGGSVKSAAKSASSAANGAKGGRPKKDKGVM